MKSVHNAMAALRCFSGQTRELAVSRVADRIKITPSSASRLLGALRDGGLLDQDPVTRRYRPGRLALVLGGLYQAHTKLRDLAQSELDALVERSGHTGYLSLLDGGDLLVIHTRQGGYPLRLVVEPGARIPAWATAGGKALLARLPDPEIRERLRRAPRNSQWPTPSPRGLQDEIARIRARGHALAEQETFPGIRAVGIAVADGEGRAFALSLSFPVAGPDRKAQDRFLGMLREAGHRLGDRFGDAAWQAYTASHPKPRPPRGGRSETMEAP
ncbi:MAG: IclR family transcriptional regulator [Alphaproteobacteria bacterium]|nr:IclR family transcriptional regulator [Alphaproteobacteria bacterium]